MIVLPFAFSCVLLGAQFGAPQGSTADDAAVRERVAIEELDTLVASEKGGTAITRRLCVALVGEPVAVRQHALSLLAQPRDREALVEGLVQAYTSIGLEMDSIRGQAQNPQVKSGALDKISGDLKEQMAAGLKTLRRLELLQEGIELAKFRIEVVGLMGEHVDERFADLLMTESIPCAFGEHAEVLLGVGRRDCVQAVVDSFKGREKERKDTEKELKKARRAKPGKAPKGWKKDRWESSQATILASRAKAVEDRLATINERTAGVLRALREFATERELPPLGERDSYSAIGSWFRKVRGEFPETLD